MIKIRMLASGEIREVSPNVAFDLIDSKVAKIYTGEKPIGEYTSREMNVTRTSPKKEVTSKRIYKDRQFRKSR